MYYTELRPFRSHTLSRTVCLVFPKHILAFRTTWLWCLCTDLVCCVYFSPVVVYFFLIHRRLFLPLLLVLFNNGNELNGKCFTCAEEESHTKEQQKYKKKNAAQRHSACFTNNWFEQCIQTKRHKKKKTSYIYKTTAASPVQSQEVLYVRVHTNQNDRIAKLEQPIGNRLKGCAYIYYTFWLWRCLAMHAQNWYFSSRMTRSHSLTHLVIFNTYVCAC